MQENQPSIGHPLDELNNNAIPERSIQLNEEEKTGFLGENSEINNENRQV